jgi:hypothetical protein
MNLDDQYNPAHRHAVEIQSKFHDYVRAAPNPYNPEATLLQHELHHLVGELERHEHPQNIEHRLKTIQREIRNAQIRRDPIMQYDHLNELQRHTEVLRQQMHRLQRP